MKDQIYLEAERLRRKFDTRDPFEIMDAMNIVVKFTRDFPRDGLKGFCTTMNKTRYAVINARLCDEEQRVVGGHELGHLILHAAELRLGAFRDHDVYNATGKTEREANFFAADLLISDDDVLEEMSVHDADFFTAARLVDTGAVFRFQALQHGGARLRDADADRTGEHLSGQRLTREKPPYRKEEAICVVATI